MLDSAGRMEQAADIILELRDDLQRANDAVQDAEHDESMAWDRVRKAEIENAKLRELVQDMHSYFHLTKVQGLCQWWPRIMRRIRNFGIKVDE
jgi:chemotaxis regulatin CheY-phosphate phosphatase CheZ